MSLLLLATTLSGHILEAPLELADKATMEMVYDTCDDLFYTFEIERYSTSPELWPLLKV